MSIKPIDGFANVSDTDVVARGTNIQTNMTGNPNFPNPPVDLATLKAAIETFAALIAEALDGSKKVVAQKNKQREAVIRMLRLLGRYVEVTCNDDMASFQTSGFEAAPPKTVTPPLTEKIRKIQHGANSGQIQSRFSKNDWSFYTQSGDHSFDASKTQFTDWNKVTVYRNGILIWGIEP